MMIHLTPGTGPRSRQRALLIAEDCLSYLRIAFTNDLWWVHILDADGRLVASKVFQPDQEEKARRWMTKHLLAQNTAVAVLPHIGLVPDGSRRGNTQ